MIRIVQCLCPSRHCLTAFAYHPGVSVGKRLDAPAEITLTEENAVDYMRLIVEDTIPAAQRRCGICGSADLRFEDAKTAFESMEEALPHLDRVERANAFARAVLGGANRN